MGFIPGLANGIHVAMVRSAAATDNREAWQETAHLAIFIAKLDCISHVEIGAGIQFGMTAL